MILSVQNVSKSFGTDEILKNVSFHIEDHEKAAVVGINGAGKSTLLKIIVGELTPDTGEVITAKGKSLGYLAQHQDLEGDRTIEEELLSVKSDVIAMEKKIRAMEKQMHHVEGAELEKLLEDYNRMHHQFELEGGLRCLKRTRFFTGGLSEKNQPAFGRTKDQSGTWKAACDKAGHHSVR